MAPILQKKDISTKTTSETLADGSIKKIIETTTVKHFSGRSAKPMLIQMNDKYFS